MMASKLLGYVISAMLVSSAAMAQDVLRIAALPYLSQGIISIGIAEGNFEAEGITVESIEMRSNAPLLPGLMSGQIDVALVIPSAGYFNAIARGGGARIVAPGVTFDPERCDYAAIYGRNGFSRQDLAATDGQDIRASAIPDTFQEYAVSLLNDLPDIGTHNIEYAFVPPYSQAEAMNNGALDLALTSEPWITRHNAGGVGQVVAGLSEMLPNAQFTYVMFAKRLLEDEPELGMRAKRAIDAAIVKYNEGKTPRNIEILSEYTGLDAELVEQACWAYVPVDGMVHMPSVVAYQTWLKDRGLVDEILPSEQIFATVPTK